MLTITDASRIVIDQSTERAGDIAMADGRVVAKGAALGADAATAAGGPTTAPLREVLDASGCVVTPGLVNAHHHLMQTAFRTLPGTRGVPMARWLPTMAAAYAESGFDGELASLAASAAVAEGLLSGVTTVADHHLAWPAGSDGVAIARATAEAARALGGRLAFVRGAARDDPQEAAASAEAIVQALLPGIHGGISDDGMLQLAVGPAGVHSDPRETFELLAEVAALHGLRRRTQANEQVDVVIALEKYGRRPIELLEEWGWLASDVTLAHLCDVSPAEVARLAAAGVSATHAPGCDLPMGWGIAPVVALRAAGIAVGLGTSGGGSNDAGHLLADARLAMQVAPLVGAPLSARQAIAMATAGSAEGLGRAELGHLRVGAAADACVWDVSGVADAGVADPVAGLLWASPGRRPKHVIVAGRVVVRDYRLVSGDEKQITADLRSRVGR
ncbi:cytosine/adenosine deaminase-related metal-dependent hydrolase [Glaciihabitans tibetensis]|uniref:Cytosine/adenosine deaminase-related metal-dependent hydrolase n=1 Tax=Glaciihabitans tibetensis TaxID=1266600 RepID=A0A2T0VG88_9MICO|nr:amidohydrolase family protein [Glaciihabitans tibetensis]PRY69074.1 cytosine/adenosine deaminase-related metal-dependent hydrolase [Glaciihabitans tibetensis]